VKKKTSIPLDQVIKNVVTLFNRSGSKWAEPPNSQSIPPKLSFSLPMKSFFNSWYIITKTPKKLKVIPNAVDLAMDLLLSNQGRKHRRISLSPI